MDKQRLIQYLQNVVDLEKQVYLQKSALYQLDNRIKTLGHEKSIKKAHISEMPNGELLFNGLIAAGIALLVYAGLLVILFPIMFMEACHNPFLFFLYFGDAAKLWVRAFKATLPYGGIICVAAFLIRVVYLYLDRKRDRQRNKEHDNNYNAAKHADAVRVNNELAQKKVLLNERAILYNRYQQTQETLRRFYDAGVIYGKYRYDFAAVASFLDYFKSGRCSTLGENRGGDGAYNLYESELRQNVIINKLDQVLSKLDQIRDNQYSLACAIQEGNRMSQRLVKATERLAIAGEQTARNSEIAAYNSQQSANELNQIKWLQLYGMTLR